MCLIHQNQSWPHDCKLPLFSLFLEPHLNHGRQNQSRQPTSRGPCGFCFPAFVHESGFCSYIAIRKEHTKLELSIQTCRLSFICMPGRLSGLSILYTIRSITRKAKQREKAAVGHRLQFIQKSSLLFCYQTEHYTDKNNSNIILFIASSEIAAD